MGEQSQNRWGQDIPLSSGDSGEPPVSSSTYTGSSMPTMPGWGSSLPPAYPTAPGALPLALQGGQAMARRRSALARPFPFWLSLLLTVGAVLITAVVYIADEVVVHGDWASGARAAGIAALALAGVTLLLLLARLSMGRRGRSTIVLSLLCAMFLASVGAGGIAFANPLHSRQGQSLERTGDWSGAIYEYEQIGESAPNAPDLARIYDEWGEQDFQQKAYKDAVVRFMTVITQLGQSGASVDRAQTDLYTTFSAWVPTNDPAIPYSDAIAVIVAYRSNPQCDATCQASAREVENQARFQFGLQLLAQQRYSAAIQQLEMVQTELATGPYTLQAHLAAARAYLALGQQQLHGTCSDAIPTYQTLTHRYGDTPEGAQAKTALSAPQSVTGNISNFADPNRTVYLSRTANPSTFSFSQDYRTTVDAHGSFTFQGVAQGKYNLSAASYVSGSYIIYPYWSEGQNVYSVQVAPLCPTQIGQLTFK